MKKTTIELDERQVAKLRYISNKLRIPMRVIISSAINEYVYRHGYKGDFRSPDEMISAIDALSSEYITAVRLTHETLMRELKKCANPSESTES